MDLCSIQEGRNKPIETLSKGYRQRLGLAQAIIHDPAILILDEPTTGLDPNQILEIRSLIRELGKSKTVILSTHILQEVEAVCSQVIIIHQGRIAAQGTSAEIGRTLKGQDSWQLELRGNLPEQLPQHVIFNDKKFVIQTQSRQDNGTVSISISHIDESTAAKDDPHSVGETIFDWVVVQGYKLVRMEHQKVSLEDIFVQLTKEGDAK